jgi:NCS1 family nucleobase:cation symporter-1
MSRFLKQGKATFASPVTFKETMQTTSGDGEVRYNKDLLPSPMGNYCVPLYTGITDIV